MQATYGMWKGRPLEELTREELIDVVVSLGHLLEAEIEERKTERDFIFDTLTPVRK